MDNAENNQFRYEYPYQKGAESLTKPKKEKSGCSLPKGIEHPLAFWYN